MTPTPTRTNPTMSAISAIYTAAANDRQPAPAAFWFLDTRGRAVMLEPETLRPVEAAR